MQPLKETIDSTKIVSRFDRMQVVVLYFAEDGIILILLISKENHR